MFGICNSVFWHFGVSKLDTKFAGGPEVDPVMNLDPNEIFSAGEKELEPVSSLANGGSNS
jgi:hypothetical protein